MISLNHLLNSKSIKILIIICFLHDMALFECFLLYPFCPCNVTFILVQHLFKSGLGRWVFTLELLLSLSSPSWWFQPVTTITCLHFSKWVPVFQLIDINLNVFFCKGCSSVWNVAAFSVAVEYFVRNLEYWQTWICYMCSVYSMGCWPGSIPFSRYDFT